MVNDMTYGVIVIGLTGRIVTGVVWIVGESVLQ